MNIGKPLDELKQDQREEINAARNLAAAKRVEMDGVFYDADPQSQTLISALSAAIANGVAPTKIEWRDADDTSHMLTQSQFVALATKVMAQVQQAYRISFDLKDQIKQCKTGVEVRAIKWPDGD